MRELEGPAQREIAAADYGRATLATCTAAAAVSASAISMYVGTSRRDETTGTFEHSASARKFIQGTANDLEYENRMAARDAHLLHNSMVFRANHPPSAHSSPTANPLNFGSGVPSGAALLPPPNLNDVNNLRHSVAAAPYTTVPSTEVSLEEGTMGSGAQPPGGDFTAV